MNRNILLGVGALAGLAGLFMLLKSKSSSGEDYFSFSTPVVNKIADTGASAYWTIDFSCTVTNNTQNIVTRTVNAWYRLISGATGEIQTDPYIGVAGETSPGRVEVTLYPGESFTYQFNGNYYDPNDLKWYAWKVIPLNGTLTVWLQDDLGNKSEEITLEDS